MNEFTVEEMRDWLKGDKPNQLAWRTNNENLRAVSEMVTLYGQTPGGEAPAPVWATIELERTAIKKAETDIETQNLRKQNLEKVAKADYLRNGGSEDEFKRHWKELKKELLTSGRAERLVEEDRAYRRSRSVRTF